MPAMRDRDHGDGRIVQFAVQFLLVLCSHFILLARKDEFQDSVLSYDFRTSSLDIWIIAIAVVCLDATIWSYSLPSYASWIALALFISLSIAKCAVFTAWNDCTIVALLIQIIIPNGALLYTISLLSSSGVGTNSGYESLLADGEGEGSSGAEAEVPKARKKVTPRRLYSLAREQRGLLGLAMIALVVATIASMAQPYIFGSVIGVCSDDGSKAELNKFIEILVVVNVIGMVATGIRGWLFGLAGERIVSGLRISLFKKIISQDISFFDSNKTGELINRLASDTAMLQAALSSNISLGLRNLASIVASVILLFITSWKLTLVMMGIVPALVISAVLYGRYTKRLSKMYQDALAKASDVGTECISNARIMKSFAAETLANKQYAESIDASYRLGAKRVMGYGGFVGGLGGMANFAIIVVVYYGSILVLEGEMSVASLTSFVLYTVYIAVGMGLIGNLYTDLMNAMGASERIFELLDAKPAINITGGKWPSQTAGIVEFVNVTFQYPTRKDVVVLRDFNLRIDKNTTVALVGTSGSGKSTVLSLLERFYDVAEGKILIDGDDVRTLDPRYLHRVVAIVPQEPVLFSGTIRSNIMYAMLAANPDFVGNEGSLCSEAQVQEAARQANAHDFIMGFPEGYDTIVGERGIRLSGGQKQRIAIARALLADPKILLLDEATSALDAESEHLVQEAIDRLMKDRTVIVIAHRLSTVKDADVIVLFSKRAGGGIVDAARHEVLLERCPEYRSLVQRQLQQQQSSTILEEEERK